MVLMTKDQKRWQAEDDAYTLIRAEAIKKDKSRIAAAKREAKKLAIEKQKEASAAKAVAKPIKKKVVKKRVIKRKTKK